MACRPSCSTRPRDRFARGPRSSSATGAPRVARVVHQRAVVRARRPACPSTGSARARCRSMSPSAARSTPSSMPRPRALPVVAERLTELRQTGMAIKHAVEAAVTVVHPAEPGLTGIYGTIFTGPASVPGADLRNVTIFAEAEVDRSPCGTGTCAVLAVLDAMGLVDDDEPFVHESIIGTTFSARVAARTTVGDLRGDRAGTLRRGVDHGRAHVHRARGRSVEDGFDCRHVRHVRLHAMYANMDPGTFVQLETPELQNRTRTFGTAEPSDLRNLILHLAQVHFPTNASTSRSVQPRARRVDDEAAIDDDADVAEVVHVVPVDGGEAAERVPFM